MLLSLNVMKLLRAEGVPLCRKRPFANEFKDLRRLTMEAGRARDLASYEISHREVRDLTFDKAAKLAVLWRGMISAQPANGFGCTRSPRAPLSLRASRSGTEDACDSIGHARPRPPGRSNARVPRA